MNKSAISLWPQGPMYKPLLIPLRLEGTRCYLCDQGCDVWIPESAEACLCFRGRLAWIVRVVWVVRRGFHRIEEIECCHKVRLVQFIDVHERSATSSIEQVSRTDFDV